MNDGHEDDQATAPSAATPGDVADELNLIIEGDIPEPTSKRKNASLGGAMLAAAMIGVGEILEPEKFEVGIEQAGDGLDDDDLLSKLTFGDLPPLN